MFSSLPYLSSEIHIYRGEWLKVIVLSAETVRQQRKAVFQRKDDHNYNIVANIN